MSTFQIIPTESGVKAIEADEQRTSIKVLTFPTQLAARQWVLKRMDDLAQIKGGAIRNDTDCAAAIMAFASADAYALSFTDR